MVPQNRYFTSYYYQLWHHPWPNRLLAFLTSYFFISTTSPMKMDMTPVPPPSVCSDGIGPKRALTATRRTREQTDPTGTYSFVSLFSLNAHILSSSSHSSSFRAATETRCRTGGQRVCIFFFSLACLLSSVLLPILLFSSRDGS